MNYAPHPDYGPCNGDKMIDYLIQKLGWVECTKMDGAIFGYNSGQYGHTGIVKDTKNNIVNDANWNPLAVGTHYLNLDAVGARYACPKAMIVSTGQSPTNGEYSGFCAGFHTCFCAESRVGADIQSWRQGATATQGGL